MNNKIESENAVKLTHTMTRSKEVGNGNIEWETIQTIGYYLIEPKRHISDTSPKVIIETVGRKFNYYHPSFEDCQWDKEWMTRKRRLEKVVRSYNEGLSV